MLNAELDAMRLEIKQALLQIIAKHGVEESGVVAVISVTRELGFEIHMVSTLDSKVASANFLSLGVCRYLTDFVIEGDVLENNEAQPG